jgi:phage RecT family recombinase
MPRPTTKLATPEAQGEAPRQTIADRVRHIENMFKRPGCLDNLTAAAAPGVSVERYISLFLDQIRTPVGKDRNYYPLANATDNSLFVTLLDSVSVGLPIGGILGWGYAVPYSGRAQFQLGYQGLIRLIQNECGASVTARMVHEGDSFEFDLGTPPTVRHTYDLRQDRGDWIGCWAGIGFADNRPWLVEVENIEKLNGHARQYLRQNKNGDIAADTLYCTQPELWYRKTMVRRAAKLAPLSERCRLFLQREEFAEMGTDMPEPMKSGDAVPPENLRAAVAAAAPLTPEGENGSEETR